MMYEEMTREELMEMVYDMDCESCEVCPFAKVCGQHELFWGCGVWEDMMGEDL